MARRVDRPSTTREIDRWRRIGHGPHIGHNCGPSNMIWSLGTVPKSLILAVEFPFFFRFLMFTLVLLPVSLMR
jgi:hypothetical protein